MEYLDAVRPPNLGINEWNDIIVRNLKVAIFSYIYSAVEYAYML